MNVRPRILLTYIATADHIMICNAKIDSVYAFPKSVSMIGVAHRVTVNAIGSAIQNMYFIDFAHVSVNDCFDDSCSRDNNGKSADMNILGMTVVASEKLKATL